MEITNISTKTYTCSTCGKEKQISTNHFKPCLNHCESCSWKGLRWDKTNNSILFGLVYRLFEIVKDGEKIDYDIRHY